MNDLVWVAARSEKTEIGGMVSAALVSTLVGLAASNLGIIPFEAPAYSIVLEFLLPLAIPLLLFQADLRSVMRSTGTLLLAFLLGSGDSFLLVSLDRQHVWEHCKDYGFFIWKWISHIIVPLECLYTSNLVLITCNFLYVTVATMVGTLVAFLVVPMRSLGSDNWKIAAALMGSYIGGCKCQDWPANIEAVSLCLWKFSSADIWLYYLSWSLSSNIIISICCILELRINDFTCVLWSLILVLQNWCLFTVLIYSYD